jgi:hypothetical protein
VPTSMDSISRDLDISKEKSRSDSQPPPPAPVRIVPSAERTMGVVSTISINEIG